MTIEPEDWEKAKAWVQENALRLRLYGKHIFGHHFYIASRTRGHLGPMEVGSLKFHVEEQRSGQELALWEIEFASGSRSGFHHDILGIWNARLSGKPPSSLEELIETGKIIDHRNQAQRGAGDEREQLKAAADYKPTIYEAYREIYSILVPTQEHWQLTSAPQEDYLEAINRDQAIIRRLKA